jgi:hypothetical protein
VRTNDRKRSRKIRPSGLTRNQIASFGKYGITEADYISMVSVIPGCAICGKSPMGKRKLSVDHDHKTGRVRGLLCSKCNFAVGLLEDNPERAEALAGYLR